MKKALLYTTLTDGVVHCMLCAHQCKIPNGKNGICGVRYNQDGELFTKAYGSIIAAGIDPVEKKPLFHFLPGSTTFSIATPGCNFKCGFCQNWAISQDATFSGANRNTTLKTPENIVDEAVASGCSSIAFTYTEPVIFFEYALETAMLAKEKGLKTIFVSNGYGTDRALNRIAPYLDACNIDLKAFTDKFYKQHCKSTLQPVLDSIKMIVTHGIHLEITTLLIPGENDSVEEIGDISKFIASIDNNIPWHVSRFFPQYKFTDYPPTPVETISCAAKIGHQSGLNYVYKGNVSGDSNTYCYKCKNTIISRSGRNVLKVNVQNGSCPACGTKIYGVW